MKRVLLSTGVIVLLAALSAAATGSAEKDTVEHNREVVRLNAQAINERDIALLEKTTAIDLIRHCQATPDIDIRSLDEFKQFLEADWSAFPDSRITITQMVAEKDKVAVFAKYEGTQSGQMGPFPPSGKFMSLDFGAIFRIENGKIAEIWVTWDNLAALSQLGHFPPPSAE